MAMSLQQWQDQLVNGILDQVLSEHSDQPRISIYQNNSRGACAAALAKTYPVCQQLLGDACFEALCHRYITDHPPKLANLNRYGDQFRSFIEEEMDSSIELAAIGYLPDVAIMEWQLQASDYAAKDLRISDERLQVLAELPEAQQQAIRFMLRSDISVLHSRYPLHLLWDHHKHADATGNDQLHLEPDDYYFCIHRQGYEPVVEPVDKECFQLLEGLLANMTMNELINTMPQALESLPMLISKQWIKDFSDAG